MKRRGQRTPTDIVVIVFAVIIILAFDIMALLTDGQGWSLIGTMAALVFTGFLIAGDGTVTISSAYNTTTGVWQHNTVPVYPYFVIGFALMVLMSVIITISIVTQKMDSNAEPVSQFG